MITPALVLSLLMPFAPGDWPQWRGPDRSGISHETDWVVEGAEQDLWKTNVGIGYSNVSVADGRLFTLGYDIEAEQDIISCLDAETGEEQWRHAYDAKRWNLGHEGGTLSTPVVDGDRVYIKNREGQAFCLRATTGEVIWSLNLMDEFGVKTDKWGFSSSPLIVNDLVILDADKTIALDKMSGAREWATESYGQAYATPVDFELGERHFLAVFNKKGLVILDVTDGSQQAVHPWPTFNDINAASPILWTGATGAETAGASEESDSSSVNIFISSGANHGCALLKMNQDSSLELIWESKVMQTAMNAAVLVDGHLFGFDNRTFKCIDLEGNVAWSERGVGLGAMSVANGKMLIVSGDGELIIAETDTGAFTEIARTKVLDGGVYWTTPVLANGLIYIRNSLGDIVCRDHRKG